MTPRSIHWQTRFPLNSGQTNTVKTRPGLLGDAVRKRQTGGRDGKKCLIPSKILRSTIEVPSKLHRSPFVTTRSQHRRNTGASRSNRAQDTLPAARHPGVAKTHWPGSNVNKLAIGFGLPLPLPPGGSSGARLRFIG